MKSFLQSLSLKYGSPAILAVCAAMFCAGITACALTDKAGITETVETVNAETGEAQSERVLTENAETVIEETTSAAAQSGGLLGLLGVVAGAAFGVYKTAKQKSALKTASAVVSGTSKILEKLNETQAEGTTATLSAADAKKILKTVQENEGVREAVREILKKQQSAETASA